MFILHEATGVLAAVSVANACIIQNTVTGGITQFESTDVTPQNLSIEHPSGEFTVSLDFERHEDKVTIKKSGVIRTTRLLSKGEVFFVI